MYAGEEYQGVARAHGAVHWTGSGSHVPVESAWTPWQRNFEQATRLEVDFWQMGLDAPQA